MAHWAGVSTQPVRPLMMVQMLVIAINMGSTSCAVKPPLPRRAARSAESRLRNRPLFLKLQVCLVEQRRQESPVLLRQVLRVVRIQVLPRELRRPRTVPRAHGFQNFLVVA